MKENKKSRLLILLLAIGVPVVLFLAYLGFNYKNLNNDKEGDGSSSSNVSSLIENETSLMLPVEENLYNIFDVNDLVDGYNKNIKGLDENNGICKIIYDNENYYVVDDDLDADLKKQIKGFKGDFKQCTYVCDQGYCTLYALNSDGNLYYGNAEYDGEEVVNVKMEDNLKLKSISDLYCGGVFDGFASIMSVYAKTYEGDVIVLIDTEPLSYKKATNTIFSIEGINVYNDKTIENSNIVSKYIFYTSDEIYVLGEDNYLYEVKYPDFEIKKVSNKKINEIKGFKFLPSDEHQFKDFDLDGSYIEFVFE